MKDQTQISNQNSTFIMLTNDYCFGKSIKIIKNQILALKHKL